MRPSISNMASLDVYSKYSVFCLFLKKIVMFSAAFSGFRRGQSPQAGRRLPRQRSLWTHFLQPGEDVIKGNSAGLLSSLFDYSALSREGGYLLYLISFVLIFEINPSKPKGSNEQNKPRAESVSDDVRRLGSAPLLCLPVAKIHLPVTAGKRLGFKSKTSPFMRALIDAECCKEVGPCSQITSGSAFHGGFSSLSGFWISSRH